MCVKFRFKPLSNTKASDRLKLICNKEGFLLNEEVTKTLIHTSRGDLRKLISSIQTIISLYGEFVTNETTFEILGLVPIEIIDFVWSSCISGCFTDLYIKANNIVKEGYSVVQVLVQLLEKSLKEYNIKEIQRSKISQYLALSEKNLLDGSDPYLELPDALLTISSILNEKHPIRHQFF